MITFAIKDRHSASVTRRSWPSRFGYVRPRVKAQQTEIRRILHSSGAQAKLTIGQPNDKYEQEADRVADRVMAMSDPKLQRQPENEEEDETLRTKPLAEQITPLVQRQEEIPEEGEELQAKAKPGESRLVTSSVESRANSMKGGGQRLDTETRSFFELRFGYNFSQVRLHTDNEAADTAKSINARAFALGNHIVMGSGEYQPGSQSGQRLLGHELTHVVQQGAGKTNIKFHSPGPIRSVPTEYLPVMRQIREEKSRKEKPKINYRRAKRQNKHFARKNVLGWAVKLSEVAGGTYNDWDTLWKGNKYNDFADVVAAYQVKQGWSGKKVDGVLGLNTWPQIAGIGEAIAGIQNVRWEDSEFVCTTATAERIKRGHKLATGKSLELAEDKTMSNYNAILQSSTGRMLDVDVKYRGAGAAGALAYAGLGELLSEADIWAGKLKPGAAIQVWGNKKAYKLLKAGEIGKDKNKRRINNTDANFYGTSFVFVRYDSKSNERMLVRHFGSTDWKSKSSYAVWVAANLNNP